MANPNPKIEHLQKNRGRKPKIGRKEFTVKLLPEEKKRLESIAKDLGFTHGNKGSISAFLNAIAENKYMVVETPEYVKSKD